MPVCLSRDALEKFEREGAGIMQKNFNFLPDVLKLFGVTSFYDEAARPRCHHFGVTSFYDENSSKLLLKTFSNVVASVNVSFTRPKS